MIPNVSQQFTFKERISVRKNTLTNFKNYTTGHKQTRMKFFLLLGESVEIKANTLNWILSCTLQLGSAVNKMPVRWI